MESNWLERNENATVVGRPERIFSDGRRTPVRSSAATTVGSLPASLHSLEAAPEEVAASTLTAEGEDTFDSLAERLVSQERLLRRFGLLSPAHLRLHYKIKLQVS